MGAFGNLDLRYADQVAPYFLLFSRTFAHGQYQIDLNYNVDKGYAYFLRYATIEYPEAVLSAAGGAIPLGNLFVKFFNGVAGRQAGSVPVFDISTPCGNGTVASLSAPNLPAVSPISNKKLNYYYLNGEAIQVQVLRGVNDADSHFFNLLLVGYYCPAKAIVR